MKNHSIIWIVSGLLVYLVYFSMFIFPCVLSINQINRFISPCVLSLGSGIVSGLLVYLVYRFICPLFIFSMRSLNKPNKPVYFSMRSLTGHQDSVQFIGLFGLLVYQFICQCILSLDSAIVSSLLVYFTMHSFTGQWDSVWFIGLFGLSVYFSMVYIGLDGWTSLLRGVCKHLIVVSTSNGSELGPVLSQIRTWQSELAFSNPTDPKTLGTFALRNRYPRQPIGTPPHSDAQPELAFCLLKQPFQLNVLFKRSKCTQ